MYIEALTKKYKNRRRGVVALDNASLTFPKKGLVFILGESGSGKTTMLNLLSLREKPTSGSVFIGGKNATKARRKEVDKYKNSYFAILSQELNLLPEFSVYKNLELARAIQGKKLTRQEAIKTLARFGLGEEILDEVPDNLSGGQRQRVALARAMVKDFKVLITDEPTGALDRKNARMVAESLKEISKDRLVITTTHDDGLAEEFADRIIRIEHGVVVDDGQSTSTIDVEKPVKVEKVKTPIKTILGLAFHGLFRNVPRLIFSLLSCVLALAVFMSTASFFMFDLRSTTYRAFKNENISYVLAERVDDHLGYLIKPVPFKLEEEQYVRSIFGDDLILETVVQGLDKNEALNGGSFSETNAFYATKENFNSFNFDLVGRLPKAGMDFHSLPSFVQDDEDFDPDVPIDGFEAEVVLTKYQCLKFGWIDEKQADDQEALKKMMAERSFYFTVIFPPYNRYVVKAKISGVVDTNFKPVAKPENNVEENIETARKFSEISYGVFFSLAHFNQLLDIYSVKNYQNVYVPVSARPLEAMEKCNSEGITSEDGIALKIQCESRIKGSLAMIETVRSTFSQVGMAVSGVLLLVTIFSFAAIMGSSFRSLDPSVKVLRSMGISSMNAMMVYISEVEMLSIACGVLGAIPYYIFVKWLEGFCRGYFRINASPFAFEPLAVLACILVMGLVSAIVSFLASKANEREASKNRYIR